MSLIVKNVSFGVLLFVTRTETGNVSPTVRVLSGKSNEAVALISVAAEAVGRFHTVAARRPPIRPIRIARRARISSSTRRPTCWGSPARETARGVS
jgi:hypothetical protein